MSDETERLSLPFLLPAQAQKHVTYNEAMLRLDHLVQLSVESRQISAPPEALLEGDSYIVPEDSTGAWSGHAGELALLVEGVWTFITPREGWRAWIGDEQGLFLFGRPFQERHRAVANKLCALALMRRLMTPTAFRSTLMPVFSIMPEAAID